MPLLFIENIEHFNKAYHKDFAPEKLRAFNTLLKYGEVGFWLFIK